MLHTDLERYTQHTQVWEGLCTMFKSGLAGSWVFKNSSFLRWLPVNARHGLSVVVHVFVIWQTSPVRNTAN